MFNNQSHLCTVFMHKQICNTEMPETRKIILLCVFFCFVFYFNLWFSSLGKSYDYTQIYTVSIILTFFFLIHLSLIWKGIVYMDVISKNAEYYTSWIKLSGIWRYQVCLKAKPVIQWLASSLPVRHRLTLCLANIGYHCAKHNKTEMLVKKQW